MSLRQAAFLTGGSCDTLRAVRFKIETELEADGRWIAEIPDLAGVMAYGSTKEEAVQRAQALALRVIADRLEHQETVPLLDVSFHAA